MVTIKEIKKEVMNRPRAPRTVYVITICQIQGRRYFNYFIARPDKFAPGHIIPKKSYKEKVIEIV